MRDKLLNAFQHASHGYSSDRVLADPELNAAYIAECERQGLALSARDLNRQLLALRKRGLMRDLQSTRTVFHNQDEYRFAAEIAVRFIERRDSISIDDIICDPERAEEFDRVASAIAPGFSSLEYRWAALSLRKLRRLSPEILGRVVPAVSVSRFSIADLDPNTLPMDPGLYLFHTGDSTLYVGETHSLRNRILKHLDHSDNKLLAQWFWGHPSEPVYLEIQVLSETVATRVRKALESELIASRSPLFNVQSVASVQGG